jgi:HEAT repeat protein
MTEKSKETPVKAKKEVKKTIRERVEQSRASHRKRTTRLWLFVLVPIVVLALVVIIFWNSIAFIWVSFNLEYGDQETRLGYLQLLINRKDKRGRDYFIKALDGNIFERHRGLKGLAFAGDASLCDKFVDIYNDTTDNYINPDTRLSNRQLALELLMQYGGADYIDFFLKLIPDNQYWQIGLEYLEKNADAAMLPRLFSMANSSDAIKRHTAVKTLFWLRDEKNWIRESKEVVEVGAGLCADNDSCVRMWACRLVEALGGRKYVPLLLERLEDEDMAVVAFAAYALEKLQDPRAVDGLVKVLRLTDVPASRAARDALLKIGSFAAIPGLFTVARDSNLDVECRLGALKVIVKLKESETNRIALELPNVQKGLISIIRSVDRSSPVESEFDMKVRIRVAEIICTILFGCIQETVPKRAGYEEMETRAARPAEDAIPRISKSWSKPELMDLIFKAFAEESNIKVKSLLANALAGAKHGKLVDYLLSWAPDARSSERRLIDDALAIVTHDKNNPRGIDFGFRDASNPDEIAEVARRVEKWIAENTGAKGSEGER